MKVEKKQAIRMITYWANKLRLGSFAIGIEIWSEERWRAKHGSYPQAACHLEPYLEATIYLREEYSNPFVLEVSIIHELLHVLTVLDGYAKKNNHPEHMIELTAQALLSLRYAQDYRALVDD